MNEAKQKVINELLTTWQPVAAIAIRAELPVRLALKHLVELHKEGVVKMSYSRIDGHNRVHMFKKIEYQTMLGVKMPVESDVAEL